MEWKIYEEWLDITLYRQMTNLIYKLSSNEEKYKIYMQLKENDMFLEKPKVDMETAYGLHYPGEVLERIGEHLTLTKQTYRALGLALARMMNINDLERLWLSLCPEFECKGNSVRYVERVG